MPNFWLEEMPKANCLKFEMFKKFKWNIKSKIINVSKPLSSSSAASRLYKWWEGGRGCSDSWSPLLPFWCKSPALSWSPFSRSPAFSWIPFSAFALTGGAASTMNFLQTFSITWLHTLSCSVWHWLLMDVVQTLKNKFGF